MTLNINQKTKIVRYLRGTGRTLTNQEALYKFDVKNLSARMSEIRQMGLRVRTRKTKSGDTAYAISARDLNGSRKNTV